MVYMVYLGNWKVYLGNWKQYKQLIVSHIIEPAKTFTVLRIGMLHFQWRSTGDTCLCVLCPCACACVLPLVFASNSDPTKC